jgi:hypothetical protein
MTTHKSIEDNKAQSLAIDICAKIDNAKCTNCSSSFLETIENDIVTALQSYAQQQVQEAVEAEREKYLQRLPEEMFSITIEARVDGQLLANRKFVSMTSIKATDGRTLLLEAEACAHQVLQALTQPQDEKLSAPEAISK